MSAERLILSGADLVLPDRVVSGGSLVIEDGLIVDVLARALPPTASTRVVRLEHRIIAPGFIDVHVHGVDGCDALGGPSAIRDLAARMPRYGVTAFCPTTVACPPAHLRRVLDAVRAARLTPGPCAARVLPAHLESNFLSPDYRGAQPLDCLRVPGSRSDRALGASSGPTSTDTFTGEDVLAVIAAAGRDVGIVTVAPEIDGGMDLVRRLAAQGILVSLGHSGATFEQGIDAIRAGARQATHLFNRMPPVGHREPGLAGAVLRSTESAAELVCDGYHVHAGMLSVAIAAKGPDRVMAITDGCAGAGLAPGARTTLGGQAITVDERAAFLDDHTLAGSTATMDRVFRVLTGVVGLSLVDAATLTSTTPARELGLRGHGVVAHGAVADLVVLDRDLRVVETLVSGRPCLARWPEQ
jgi:N-acetylglucosamine-6-phosphate deacetylase